MMTSIIKKVSIARGYDPRDFALFCYGGGGPLHGVELARALKIPRVIVPPEPGNFSAIGMLLADPRLDTARTAVMRLNPESLPKIAAIYQELENEGLAALRREFGDGKVTLEREAEMRYKGQHHSIKIPVSPTMTTPRRCARASIEEYLRRYGHANTAAEAEIVVLHSLATLHTKRPDMRQARAAGGRGQVARTTVCGRCSSSKRTASCRRRSTTASALEPGRRGRGPALIVEYGSSTLIGPGDTFTIGKLGEIDIDCTA